MINIDIPEGKFHIELRDPETHRLIGEIFLHRAPHCGFRGKLEDIMDIQVKDGQWMHFRLPKQEYIVRRE